MGGTAGAGSVSYQHYVQIKAKLFGVYSEEFMVCDIEAKGWFVS
jgi:hypothetical protein